MSLVGIGLSSTFADTGDVAVPVADHRQGDGLYRSRLEGGVDVQAQQGLVGIHGASGEGLASPGHSGGDDALGVGAEEDRMVRPGVGDRHVSACGRFPRSEIYQGAFG